MVDPKTLKISYLVFVAHLHASDETCPCVCLLRFLGVATVVL